MRKISLYRFLTTFCIVPVNDWLAFAQRVFSWVVISTLVWRLISLLKQPLFIASLIALLIYAPETIMWIFIKIGELEMLVFAIILNQLMPEVFGEGTPQFNSWSEIWSTGLNALPPDLVDVINCVGVAQLMGLITATIGAVSAIKIYRKVMLRAGLL